MTNGDAAAQGLREGGVREPIVPWRDVLHEGPVPSVPAAELAAVRAEFLAAAFDRDAGAIRQEMLARDDELAAAAGGRIVLWFDADLYDQLQLLQILERLDHVKSGQVTLVSVGEYTGRAHFGGLGELSGADLVDLRRTAAQEVTADDLAIAAGGWRAFTAANPGELTGLVRAHSPALRHLGEGVERLLQEYPWTGDGLSLTERRILRAIEGGAQSLSRVFREVWAAERRPFAADAVVSLILDRLVAAGLARGDEGALQLTTNGHAALAGDYDLGAAGVDRWIGGVHLTSPPAWRWDPRAETLVSAAGA